MKRSKIKMYEKILREDKDFDFAYLLILERFKLKKMIKNFQEAQHPTVGIEYTIRDMQICVNLIDIILEEDSAYKTYLKQYENLKMEFLPDGRLELGEIDVKIPIYINIKNKNRFFSDTQETSEIFLMEFRRIKALHLYNKIRNRMFSWWW